MADLSDAAGEAARRRWLGAAFVTVAIGFATLWPFQFVAPGSSWIRQPSLFIVGWGRSSSLDMARNVLLFIPLGIAIARCYEFRARPSRVVVMTLATAACVSYGIELLQTLLPSRFSSIIDVLANISGAAVGVALYSVMASDRSWLRAPAYFAVVCALAVPLHRLALLDGWDPSLPLVLGNEANGARPWTGRITEVCFADGAVNAPPDGVEGHPSCQQLGPALVREWLASETGLSSDQDQLRAPTWAGPGATRQAHPLSFRPDSWLSSKKVGGELTARFKETDAFSVLAIFATDDLEQTGPARLVSLSADADRRNFTLGQDRRDVIARLRTRVTNTNGTGRELRVRNVLRETTLHWALFTYDGSTQCLTVDGHAECVALTPGITAAALLHRRLPARGPARAWDALYYAAAFIPLGLVLKTSAFGPSPFALGTLAFWLTAYAIALEGMTAAVPGREVRWSAIAVSIAFGAMGCALASIVRRFHSFHVLRGVNIVARGAKTD